MQISLYVHVWQAILMFLAGVAAIVCSFVGFLRTGGGEQLVQQALLSFLPTHGRANFRQLDFDFRRSKLTVHDLYHSDIVQGENQVSGLRAETCEVLLDLWPRPAVTSVAVHGMRELKVRLQKGFLQEQQRDYPKGPPFPVYFEAVDCEAQVGDTPTLRLKGCGGTVNRGPGKELRGEFSLRELNGQPFDFRLAALPDGRWELRGTELAIDTRQVKLPPGHPKAAPGEKLEPVELLLRSLWSGEGAAKGTVSLWVVFQPAAAGRAFACEGQLAYRGLELQLPAQDVQSWVLPVFLEWVLGERRGMWPHLLMADGLRTGGDGRLSFHMHGQRLNFACDEGPGSALILRRMGVDLAPLEALKGCVWTDADYRPRLISLRGVLGGNVEGELRMERTLKGGVYEMVVQPRVLGVSPTHGQTALWRFHTWLEDCGEPSGSGGAQTVLKFSTAVTSTRFGEAFLLPPGARDFSGGLRFSGRLTTERQVLLDEISWEDGGLEFGGTPETAPSAFARATYGPVFEALRYLWGRGPPWRLQGVRLKGQAQIRLDAANVWQETCLYGWKLEAGSVVYEGRATDLAELGLRVIGEYRRDPENARMSNLLFRVQPTDPEGKPADWSMSLVGVVDDKGDSVVRFEERQVPLKIHPERGKIESQFIRGPFDRRVVRKREVELRGGKATVRLMPLD